MNKQTEALKLALEALKMCRGLIRNNIENLVPIASPNPWFSQDVDHAITAIREALAEQPAQQDQDQGQSCYCPNCEALSKELAALKAQEPVAWRTFDGEGGYDYRTYDMNKDYADEWNKQNPKHKGWVEPLYTSPQPSKPWVGLTDEEKTEIRREHYARTLPLMDAVESKLREKNA